MMIRRLRSYTGQYHLEDDILYYVAADKTLQLIQPTSDRKQLLEHIRGKQKLWWIV